MSDDDPDIEQNALPSQGDASDEVSMSLEGTEGYLLEIAAFFEEWWGPEDCEAFHDL